MSPVLSPALSPALSPPLSPALSPGVCPVPVAGSTIVTFPYSDIYNCEPVVVSPGSTANGGVRLNVGNVNQEGVLIVRPANDSVALNPQDFVLLNAGYDLVFGTAQGTGTSLYLGTKSEHTHEWGSFRITSVSSIFPSSCAAMGILTSGAFSSFSISF